MTKVWFLVLKAVFTRILFLSHSLVAIYVVVQLKGDSSYYLLTLVTVAQVAEGIFTMAWNRGGEWKWFCPGVFLFLVGSVPAVWLLELHLLQLRLESMRHVGDDIIDDVNESNYGSIIEVVLIMEQMLPLLLIVGRWLLPKGAITRDELSQLLLVYFATAADIIEFFDGFNEDKVKYNRSLVVALLTLWSWSLLQFSLVMTSTRTPRDSPSSTARQNGDQSSSPSAGTRRGGDGGIKRSVFARFPRLAASRIVVAPQLESALVPVKQEREVAEDTTPAFTCLDNNVWSIVASILLQDLPFLLFRLIIILHFNVVSHTSIFFTCKNTIILVLQTYRIIVLHVDRRETLRKQREAEVALARKLSLLRRRGFSFLPEDLSSVSNSNEDTDPYVAAVEMS